MEMLAVAVAVGVTATGVGGVARPPAANAEVVESVERGRASEPRASRRHEARPAATAAAAEPERRWAAAPERQEPAKRTRVAQPAERNTPKLPAPVKVRNRYPDESKTQEIADVTIFANGDETSLRLYADEVNDAAKAAHPEAVRRVRGRASFRSRR